MTQACQALYRTANLRRVFEMSSILVPPLTRTATRPGWYEVRDLTRYSTHRQGWYLFVASGGHFS